MKQISSKKVFIENYFGRLKNKFDIMNIIDIKVVEIHMILILKFAAPY